MLGKLTERHGTYVYQLDDIVITMTNLHQGRDDLTAEVEVYSGIAGLIADARLNLVSLPTISSWAKQATLKHPDEDWQGILTDVCRAVKLKLREGTPSADLNEPIAEDEAGEWLVPGFALRGLPTVLFGAGDSCKSFLGLSLLAQLQTGARDPLGLDIRKPGRCLILDWEMSRAVHRERLYALTARTDQGIRYRSMSGTLTSQAPAIAREIDKHAIDYLMIDSAAYACGKPEDAAEVNALFDSLRWLGRTSIIVAHESKDQSRGTSHEYPFGSIFWHNACRQSWFVKKVKEARTVGTVTTTRIGLYNRKSNTGPRWLPRAYEIRMVNSADWKLTHCEIEGIDLQQDSELRRDTSVASQMLALLGREGPLTSNEIAERLDALQNTVSKALVREQAAGRVAVVGTPGKGATYGLPQQPRRLPYKDDTEEYAL